MHAEGELGPRISDRNEVQGCLASVEAEELRHAPVVKCADRHRTQVECDRLEEQVLCSVARFESRITTGPVVAVFPARGSGPKSFTIGHALCCPEKLADLGSALFVSENHPWR